MSKFNVMNFHHLFYKTCTYKHIRATRPTGPVHDPRMKTILFQMIDFDSSQSLEVSKIKIKIRKQCFSYMYFYFWNFKRLWTHNHRLVKYMYRSMHSCDACL